MTKKQLFFYQRLENDQVKIIAHGTNNAGIVSTKEFEEFKRTDDFWCLFVEMIDTPTETIFKSPTFEHPFKVVKGGAN